MPLATRGIILPQDVSTEVINDVSVAAIQFFYNEFPLMSRLMREPVGTNTFVIRNHKDRPLTYTLGGTIAANSTTTISFTDATTVMPGDVYEIGTERFEVVDTAATLSSLTANQLVIRRGAEGTTAAAVASVVADAVKLISNTRTGGEVDQPGFRTVRADTSQYCQTWQFPVQVSGSANSENIVGIPNLFMGERQAQLRNMYRDMERSALYQIGEAPGASNGRAKQKGLKTLIVTNKVTSPTNASAYAAVDLIRDTFQACRTAGGDPDVLLVAGGFMTGLAKWGMTPQRIDAGKTAFGVAINSFNVPFLSSVTVIEANSLNAGTAVALTSSEIRYRNKRNEFWNPRGNRGDAIEADWIAEGAIELTNETHHAWVEGVTAFAA